MRIRIVVPFALVTSLLSLTVAGQAQDKKKNAAPAPPPPAKTAAESMKLFRVADDLKLEQVLAEPVVAQPVFLTFDERGRLWVVQ